MPGLSGHGFSEDAGQAPQRPSADTFGVLVRLFFSRFFDKESLSPQGDPEAGVVQTLGILAAPGGFISLILYFNPQIKTGWNLVSVRCLFLWLSMVVVAFVVVLEWDVLFLDRRDYQVLLPLPLPLWKVFLAKMTAFMLFLGLFLAAINGAATLFWSSVFDSGNFFAVAVTHLLIVTASGLFAAFAVASIQGLLLITVPVRLFRPVATSVQTILMTVLVTLFFVSPLLAGIVRTMVAEYNGIARYVPACWYLGLYEQARPAVGNRALLDLGRMALPGLGCAVAAFALTHLPAYRWQMHRLIDTPPYSPSGPGRLRTALNAAVDCLLLKNPVQQGVYHFVGQTISRSMKHRLFLAVYAGFGAALVVLSLGRGFAVTGIGSEIRVISFAPDRATLLRVPLTLSFVLVTGLRAAFSFPAELSANWGFQISDTNNARNCLTAVRKWIVVCGVIPLFLLLAPGELQFLRWSDVLFETLYGITLSLFLTETMFLGFRRIPFTCGYFPGKTNLVLLVTLYVGGVALYSSSLMTDLESRLMKNPLAATGFFCGALALYPALWKWRDWAGVETRLDYQGEGDPVIRTLELTPH
jgi:hypothetical protein